MKMRSSEAERARVEAGRGKPRPYKGLKADAAARRLERSTRRDGRDRTLTLPFNLRYLPGRVTAAPRPNARVRAALPLLTPISMYPLDPM
jgi:hypothetical protein